MGADRKSRRRARGSIRPRGRSWQIVVSNGVGPAGRQVRVSENVPGAKKDAERRLTELLALADKGIPVVPGKLTAQDYLTAWLRDVVAVRNRPRTVEAYGIIVRRHIVPHVGKVLLTKLQPADVDRMYRALTDSGLSKNTVHHVHIVLGKSLKDAMRKGIVHRIVTQAAESPRPGPYEVHFPDSNNISRILELAKQTPYHAALHLMAYTGLRRGEAIALKWESVDLGRGVLSVVETAQRLKGRGVVFMPPKSSAGRRGVALDPVTVQVLREHQGQQLLHKVELEGAYQDNGLVFPGPLGGPLDPSVLTRTFEKLVKRAGIKGMRLHDLRHGHAAGLIRAGVHPRVVQDRLGHGSAAFTMQVYGHVAADLQTDAAAAFADMMKKRALAGS